MDNVTSEVQRKLSDLEDRSKRNNLIVYGISETSGETESDLKQAIVNEVFTKKLGVKVTNIERIHRIGNRADARHRPVILKLYNFQEKIAVLRSCAKLKGSDVSVGEDFSIATRLIRKKLW